MIFFNQKAIFAHILLTTSLYVQLLSSHFKRESTRQSIKIYNIYHIDLQERRQIKAQEYMFLQKVSQNAQNIRFAILLK